MTPRDSHPSHPPGLDGLRAVTEQHRKANDAHESSVGHMPLPAAVAVAALDLTDEQRVAVAREMLAVMRGRASSETCRAVEAYMRNARERLGR